MEIFGQWGNLFIWFAIGLALSNVTEIRNSLIFEFCVDLIIDYNCAGEKNSSKLVAEIFGVPQNYLLIGHFINHIY